MKIKLIISILLVLIGLGAQAQLVGPDNKLVCPGEDAVFVVKGLESGMTIQWQIKNGAAYTDITSEVNDTIIVSTSVESAGSVTTYRCKAMKGSKVSYTNDFSLEVGVNPVPSFSYNTPCDNQEVNFSGNAETNNSIAEWRWYFTDNDSSVYRNPDYFYGQAGEYDVELKVVDSNGCEGTIIQNVTVYPSPSSEFSINENERVLCSNEIATYFLEDLEADEDVYHWSLSASDGEIYGYKIDSTKNSITVDWDIVEDPIMVSVLAEIRSEHGCESSTEYDVLITNYEAPEMGVVFQKPYESSLLIYKDENEQEEIDVLKYQWGYTDDQGKNVFIPDEGTENNYYHDFESLNENYKYWVETSFGSQIKCKTRNYFGEVDIVGDKSKSSEMDNILIDTREIGDDDIIIEVYDLYNDKIFFNNIRNNTGSTISIHRNDLVKGINVIKISNSNKSYTGVVTIFN